MLIEASPRPWCYFKSTSVLQFDFSNLFWPTRNDDLSSSNRLYILPIDPPILNRLSTKNRNKDKNDFAFFFFFFFVKKLLFHNTIWADRNEMLLFVRLKNFHFVRRKRQLSIFIYFQRKFLRLMTYHICSFLIVSAICSRFDRRN